MAIPTTCIGAYPKPDYINNGIWSESKSAEQVGEAARGFSYVSDETESVSEDLLDQATREAVTDQVSCGIDIPTDGEQRRENYIHYHCRHLHGMDFETLTTKVHRNGAAVADLPTVTDKIEPNGEHFLDRDFASAQACTENPIKITLPGPVTIIDTTADTYYKNDKRLAFDLADALNYEIRALAEAGCRYIQIDEPLFVRNVDYALEFGVECLERCFDGVADDVTRVMHMCCGYPGHLDDEGYAKADPNCYLQVAKALDASSIDQVSIEDAHRHNKGELLELFQSTSVILGSVAIATSRVETVDEIASRLSDMLKHIDPERLIAAPDCGLLMLGRDLAMRKLTNLCRAAAEL